jgi:hypothetical protein
VVAGPVAGALRSPTRRASKWAHFYAPNARNHCWRRRSATGTPSKRAQMRPFAPRAGAADVIGPATNREPDSRHDRTVPPLENPGIERSFEWSVVEWSFAIPCSKKRTISRRCTSTRRCNR